jgi:type IV pilus assembly protein PilN
MYQNPIKLNLLPFREALKETRKKEFFTRALLVAILSGALMLLAWQLINQYISNQQERNNFIGAEIKKLDAEIGQIAKLEQEIEALKARQRAVEDLQSDRNLPVHVFEELTKYVPEGVYLKSIKQDVKKVTITGVAQSQERVSEMLRNFNTASVWLESPELLEIKLAAPLANTPKTGAPPKLYDFTIAVLAKREKKAPIPGAPNSPNNPNNPNAVGNTAPASQPAANPSPAVPAPKKP